MIDSIGCNDSDAVNMMISAKSVLQHFTKQLNEMNRHVEISTW